MTLFKLVLVAIVLGYFIPATIAYWWEEDPVPPSEKEYIGRIITEDANGNTITLYQGRK